MDEILEALTADAERAYGAARTARLKGSLERLAGAISAVWAYPLASGVEPATMPDLPRLAPMERSERV